MEESREKEGLKAEEDRPEEQAAGKASADPVTSSAAPTSQSEEETAGSGEPHPFEELLDDYPLRDKSEDPVWSVRIVRGWIWFMYFSIAGIVLLLVLGLFYD